jgi:hypothetical protein
VQPLICIPVERVCAIFRLKSFATPLRKEEALVVLLSLYPTFLHFWDFPRGVQNARPTHVRRLVLLLTALGLICEKLDWLELSRVLIKAVSLRVEENRHAVGLPWRYPSFPASCPFRSTMVAPTFSSLTDPTGRFPRSGFLRRDSPHSSPWHPRYRSCERRW